MTERRHRVAITGVGVISAAVVGGFAALGAFLGAPRSVVRRVDTAAGSERYRAEIETDPLDEVIDPSESRRLTRVCRLTVGAARLALADAGGEPPASLGVIVGTELGDFRSTIEFADGYLSRGPAGLSALLFPNTVMNTMASATAIAVGARECSLTLNTQTVAGELAVARGAMAVASGRLDAVLAGGVDQLDPIIETIVEELGAGGEARGEGATVLVLERLESARRRGARVAGEIRGFAWGSLPARPSGVGRARESRAIRASLDSAGLDSSEIGWVYDSASNDPSRDRWERTLLDAALASGPPSSSLATLVGRHSGLGPMGVAAGAWTAGAGLLPRTQPTVADRAGSTPKARQVARGPGLVHGVGRGGTHVALVVGGAP